MLHPVSTAVVDLASCRRDTATTTTIIMPRTRRAPTNWNNFCSTFAAQLRSGQNRSSGDGGGGGRLHQRRPEPTAAAGAPPMVPPMGAVAAAADKGLKSIQAASKQWRQMSEAERSNYAAGGPMESFAVARREATATRRRLRAGGDRTKVYTFKSRTEQMNGVLNVLRSMRVSAALAERNGHGDGSRAGPGGADGRSGYLVAELQRRVFGWQDEVVARMASLMTEVPLK